MRGAFWVVCARVQGSRESFASEALKRKWYNNWRFCESCGLFWKGRIKGPNRRFGDSKRKGGNLHKVLISNISLVLGHQAKSPLTSPWPVLDDLFIIHAESQLWK
jgi:hypothetical protein